MKHKGLLITVIICLFVFVTTLITGIILAGTTVGWSKIGESIRTGTFTERFFNNFGNWGGGFGPGIGYNIDETRTDNLQGVDTILVRAVSERVNVTEGGSQLTARLSGSYTGMSPLEWDVQRQGSTLVIKTRYPWLGLRLANLTIDLQIPRNYAGNVEVRAVSGACGVTNSQESAWKSFKYDGVSGALQAMTAVWPQADFKSVSGAIRANLVKGQLNANSVSGSIDISYGADAIPQSSLETVSGRITVGVSPQSRFSLLFTTVSGGFNSAGLPLQFTSQANRRIEATFNGGGNQIVVKTVSGSLVVQPLAITSASKS